ncbi:hypothetical protein P171DRAFT_45961 [Karstenula rhodostoma CBS 690.94]|uniref:Uncharacterized protein n=1 Tax=Karstenula rhodostoma CBS 690.94 TaxID=1392251 RepID=A0A9P4PH86_9PLEO|nr:hypothetical protein P171DRAFT_45961 [Karstenula rhodostoma CBS 690.94]
MLFALHGHFPCHQYVTQSRPARAPVLVAQRLRSCVTCTQSRTKHSSLTVHLDSGTCASDTLGWACTHTSMATLFLQRLALHPRAPVVGRTACRLLFLEHSFPEDMQVLARCNCICTVVARLAVMLAVTGTVAQLQTHLFHCHKEAVPQRG